MGAAHVLLVEDEVLVRAFIAEELRAAGCAVIEASHAQEALDYMHAGGKVDLLFSDIQMPGALNGLQLAERIRHEYPAIPIILISGNVEMAQSATSVLFLAKPYDVEQTVALVFATLGRPQPRNHV